MQAQKATLNLKITDSNLNSKSVNIGYVNPNADETALRTFAQKANNLTNNTLTAINMTVIYDLTDASGKEDGYWQLSSSDVTVQRSTTDTSTKVNATYITDAIDPPTLEIVEGGNITNANVGLRGQGSSWEVVLNYGYYTGNVKVKLTAPESSQYKKTSTYITFHITE